MIYRFNDFTLNTESLELRRGDETIPVEPQVFSVLAYLIEHRERVVGKDELIEAVWGGRAISDGALNSRINAARRAVGDNGDVQEMIKTFPRRGFRFVGTVGGESDTSAPTGTVASPTKTPSVAVLPFSNVSGDPRQDFIGDGLATDIIAAMSRIRSFVVIARNSTFQYKGRSPDVRQVAQDLNVRYVVEGNTRRSEDRLRISVQLIDGSTGHSLWAIHYDRDIHNLFDVLDELTLAIVGQLEPELARAEYDRARTKRPEGLDAWELYHRGAHLLHRFTPEDQVEARRYFAAAIERDPNFAAPHAAICFSSFLQTFYEERDNNNSSEALAAGNRAVELDDRDPRGHYALAFAHLRHRNFDTAIHEAKLALDLNPSFASAYHALAACYAHTGRAEDALPLLDSAMSLSPRDPEIGLFLARAALASLYLRQHEDAVKWARAALKHRTGWPARSFLISALGHLNRREEARSAIDEFVSVKCDASVAFVADRVLTVHQPDLDHLIEGLRNAGLREHAPPAGPSDEAEG